ARAVDTRAAELGLARQERRDLVEAARAGFVLPGSEQLLPYLYEEPGSLADYLPAETFLWTQAPAEVEAALETMWTQIEEHAAAAARDGRFHPPPEGLYVRPSGWRTMLESRPVVEVEGLDLLADDSLKVTSYSTEGLGLRTGPAAEGALAPVVTRLTGWQREGARLVLVATSVPQRDRLQGLLAGHGITLTASGARFPQALAAAGRRRRWRATPRGAPGAPPMGSPSSPRRSSSESAVRFAAACPPGPPTGSRASPNSSRTTTSSTPTTASASIVGSVTCRWRIPR